MAAYAAIDPMAMMLSGKAYEYWLHLKYPTFRRSKKSLRCSSR